MKTFITALLLALATCCGAQTNPTIINSAFLSSNAATPTFSPAAGGVASGTTVTISTATSGCSGSIVYNTTGASSGGNLAGTTTGTSVVVSSAETVYAQVQGCAGYNNSGIGSAAYTITKALTFVHTYECDNYANNTSGSVTCPLTATAAGNGLMAICATSGTSISASSPTLATIGTPGNPESYFTAAFLTSPVTTGTTSATFTGSGAYIYMFCVMAEVKGVNATTNIDPGGSAIANPTQTAYGTGAATAVTGSVTTTNANDTICGYVSQTIGLLGALTAGTGYTLAVSGNASTGGNGSTGIECLTTALTSTTTANPGFQWTTAGRATAGTFSVQLQ